MARQIKWRLQFKSLAGVGCLVNIYEENHISSAVTSKTGADVPFAAETGVTNLTGAATPFYYQEDTSNDLLNFVRTKTGYISVIEDNYGDLNSLYPNSATQHYVEAYYGSKRVFTGYMQCTEYSNAYVACPRVIDFAVVSPLGLLSSMKFSTAEPTVTTMGALLQEVLQGINPGADGNGSDYGNVIWPKVETDKRPWNESINRAIFCPFAELDQSSSVQSQAIYNPKDFDFFIKNLCANYGWLVHDTANSVVFTQFDKAVVSSKTPHLTIAVANLANNVSPSEVSDSYTGTQSFTAGKSNIDRQAQWSVVRPLQQIEVKYNNTGFPTLRLNTDGAITSGNTSLDYNNRVKVLRLRQINPHVVSSHLGVWQGGNTNDVYGVFPIAFGTYATDDKTMSIDSCYIIKYHPSWSDDVMRIVFPSSLPLRNVVSGVDDCMIKIAAEIGTSLKQLKATGFPDITMTLGLKIGNQYYNFSNPSSPSSTPIYSTVTIDGSTGKLVPNKSLVDDFWITDVDGYYFNISTNKFLMAAPIELIIKAFGTSDINKYIKLDVSIVKPTAGFSPYNYNPASSVIRKNSSTDSGVGKKSMSLDFTNHYTYNGPNYFRLTGSGMIDCPAFSYMFKPLNVLLQKYNRTFASISDGDYLPLYTFGSYKGKLIGESFNLRDDAWTLQLAMSSIFNS